MLGPAAARAAAAAAAAEPAAEPAAAAPAANAGEAAAAPAPHHLHEGDAVVVHDVAPPLCGRVREKDGGVKTRAAAAENKKGRQKKRAHARLWDLATSCPTGRCPATASSCPSARREQRRSNGRGSSRRSRRAPTTTAAGGGRRAAGGGRKRKARAREVSPPRGHGLVCPVSGRITQHPPLTPGNGHAPPGAPSAARRGL